jgi:hypothetical protein
MPRTIEERSSAGYAAGIRGFVWGAIIGAIVTAIVGVIFGLLDVGAGGVGLHTAAGACVGGIIGAMYTMIRNRH